MRHRVVSAAMVSYRRPTTNQTKQNISAHTVGFFFMFYFIRFFFFFANCGPVDILPHLFYAIATITKQRISSKLGVMTSVFKLQFQILLQKLVDEATCAVVHTGHRVAATATRQK